MFIGRIFNNISQRLHVFFEKLIWLFHNNIWYKRGIQLSLICSFGLIFYVIVSRIVEGSIELEGIFDIYLCILVGSLIASIIFIFLSIVLTSLFYPRGSVDPNIFELPKDFKGNKVIVEFNPPRGLGPSEVGIIYSLGYDWTNLSCLIYKWISERLVVREIDRDYGTNIIRRVGQLKYTTPSYERAFRRFVFAENNTDYFFEDYIYKYSDNIMDSQQALVDYCVEKGYLVQKNKCRKSSSPNKYLLLIVFMCCPLIAISLYVISLCNSRGGPLYKINLGKLERTKKGDELYAKILGYKYFLEHCDEEKMKEVLKQDSEYIDKILPYVIALRLNWKFLDRSYLN